MLPNATIPLLSHSMSAGTVADQVKSTHALSRPIDFRPRGLGDTVAARKFTVVGWERNSLLGHLSGGQAARRRSRQFYSRSTNLLGDHGIVASRIGNDTPGKLRRRQAHPHRSRYHLPAVRFHSPHRHRPESRVNKQGDTQLQNCPTGCLGSFRMDARMEILGPLRSDAVCFSSLAHARPQSWRTAFCCTRISARHESDGAAHRVFDVNLRQAFYTPEIIAESLKIADVVKLNQEELRVVAEMAGIPHTDDRTSAQRLLGDFQLKLVCVTRGASGSILCSEKECDVHPGFHVKVADMVGAGRRLHRRPGPPPYLRRSPLGQNERRSQSSGSLGSQPERRHAHPRQAPAKESPRRRRLAPWHHPLLVVRVSKVGGAPFSFKGAGLSLYTTSITPASTVNENAGTP